MPVFEGPARDENPIPERESNILPLAFPKLFQRGIGDIFAPRLHSLEEGGQDVLQVYATHCLYWHDNRFAKHPRFLYILFNRWLRWKLLKTKSFFIKNRNPTINDFLPENKKKTIKEMRAYTAKLPTTPGFKLARRNELELMVNQIKYMTANKKREERVMIHQEYEVYESSDDENKEGPPSFWNPCEEEVADINDHEEVTQTEQSRTKPKTQPRPIEGRIPCYWATLTTAPFRSSVHPYYIEGNHNTEKDVKIRRRLAMENPNIVAYFSALQLELVLKYVMQLCPESTHLQTCKSISCS